MEGHVTTREGQRKNERCRKNFFCGEFLAALSRRFLQLKRSFVIYWGRSTSSCLVPTHPNFWHASLRLHACRGGLGLLGGVAAAGGRTWQTAAPVATSLNSTRALPWVFQTRGRSREIVADICPWEVEDAESSGPMPTKQCFDFRVLLKSQAVSPPLCRSEREKPAR